MPTTLQLVDLLMTEIRDGAVAPVRQALAKQPVSAKAEKSAAKNAEKPAAPKAKNEPAVKAKNEPKPTAAKPEVGVAKAAAAPQAKAAAARESTPTPPAAAGGGSGLAPTEALYQTDTYLFTATATVIGITPLDGEQWAVMLDATCFHPQGGGQPADVGTITSIEGGDPYVVKGCKKDPAGVVSHQGDAAPTFAVGAKVNLSVEQGPRVKNARVHSAGHLIDVAMTACGVGLKPTKGYHFTPGAYVEYEGKLSAEERDALVPKLQASMDELVAKVIPTVVQSVDASKLDTVCPLNSLPADRSLWVRAPLRCTLAALGCLNGH